MTPITPGIDVSHHQAVIDWQQVADSGQRFAVIRSSMGAAGRDNRFAQNWDGAVKAGLLVGAYHLVRPEHSGAVQVEHFLNVMENRKSDLPLVLDVELDGRTSALPSRTPDEIAQCVRDMAAGLMARGHRRPIIYTARWFWNKAVTITPEWEAYDLWVAHYGAAAPVLPSPWKSYTFWQYTDAGTVPGVPTPCDLNWYAGSHQQLLVYTGRVPAQPPPVPALMRVVAQTVNIRTGPDTNFSATGMLRNGQTIPILALDGRDMWVRIGVDRWAALAFRGQRFMRVLANDDAGENGLRAEVIVDAINVRNGPGQNFADVGDLRRGEVFNVTELSGSNIWVEFEPGKWSAFSAGGRRFMTLA